MLTATDWLSFSEILAGFFERRRSSLLRFNTVPITDWLTVCWAKQNWETGFLFPPMNEKTARKPVSAFQDFRLDKNLLSRWSGIVVVVVDMNGESRGEAPLKSTTRKPPSAPQRLFVERFSTNRFLISISISRHGTSPSSENTHHRGKYDCNASLLRPIL